MAFQISRTKHIESSWASESRYGGIPASRNAPALVLREIAVVLATVLTLIAAIDVALTVFGIR